MGFTKEQEVREKATGEGVGEAIREAFQQLFDKLPITSTTTTS